MEGLVQKYGVGTQDTADKFLGENGFGNQVSIGNAGGLIDVP